MTDCIHDVAHLVSLPINFIHEDAKTVEFLDDVVFVDGDWNKNSAVIEQNDLLGAVSVVADDAVPDSEVLKVAQTVKSFPPNFEKSYGNAETKIITTT